MSIQSHVADDDAYPPLVEADPVTRVVARLNARVIPGGRAAPAYCSLIRVSKMNGRREDDDSTQTVRQQRGANEAAIEQVGGQVLCEFKMLDSSGATITDSAEWRRALELCQSGEAKGIVLAWGDRLTRDLWRVGPFLSQLKDCDAEILVAGMPGVDYRTPMGRAMLNQVLAMADFQLQMYRERGMKTIDEMLARRVPNSVPYGYRRNNHAGPGTRENPELADKALVPDPNTAPFVKKIYEWRAQAKPLSWRTIAQNLEALGAPRPTARAQMWHNGALTKMIGNRAYLGEINFGDRPRIPNAHEPLIDVKTWTLAQLKAPTVRNGRLSNVGLGRGIMRCSTCKEPMSIKTTSQNAGGTIVYACVRTMCPRHMAIMLPVVDEFLDNWIRDAINGTRNIVVFAAARELSQARATLDAKTTMRDELLDKIGQWSPDVLDRAMRRIDVIVNEAQAHYEALLEAQQVQADMPQTTNAWDDLTVDEKRRVLTSVIDSIEVLPSLNRNRWGDPLERLVLRERGGQ